MSRNSTWQTFKSINSKPNKLTHIVTSSPLYKKNKTLIRYGINEILLIIKEKKTSFLKTVNRRIMSNCKAKCFFFLLTNVVCKSCWPFNISGACSSCYWAWSRSSCCGFKALSAGGFSCVGLRSCLFLRNNSPSASTMYDLSESFSTQVPAFHGFPRCNGDSRTS